MLKTWMEKEGESGEGGTAGPAGLVLTPNKQNCQLQNVPASLLSSQWLQPRSSGGGEVEVEVDAVEEGEEEKGKEEEKEVEMG